MAKKMQRLDESPDFRPFKFRIQAFTNAFLEELARQGYPEDKIPMKKVRRLPVLLTSSTHLRTLVLSSYFRPDPELPLELAIHLALQRGRKEVQIEGQPYLARGREEVRRRLALPAVPAQARRRASGRRLHRPPLVLDAADMGSPGVAGKYACHVHISCSSVVALLGG